jgi:hypothetical protein
VRETVKVATSIQDHSQRDRWSLAYALLADMPLDLAPAAVRKITDDLCAEMFDLGLSLPNGAPYHPAYLQGQRKVAIAWRPEERQAEASFEAHAEHTGESRPVLLALCAVARGEQVERPLGTTPISWDAAVAKTKTRKMGYMVQAQAVRMALGKRAKNTPTRLDGNVTFSELLRHIMTGTDGLRAFYAKASGHDLNDEDRATLLKALDAHDAASAKVRTILTVNLSDEKLAELLS